MSDTVRCDLMAAAIKRVRVLDALANLLARSAETDAGVTSPLVWALIDVSAGIGDEIAAADKKGEVNAIAISVQLGGEIGELLPALQLGAIVERHDDELRRAIDARFRRRKDAQYGERRQCGDDPVGGQFSPPDRK